MTERGRREYAERLRQRYGIADKRERGRLLDEYCRITECHRKAAIRRLRAVGRPRGRAPGRPVTTGRALLPLLERAVARQRSICRASCSTRLCPTLLTALQTHHGLAVPAHVRTALLAASPATLDRLLRPLRRRRPPQPRRAGTALACGARPVPLRTWSEWTGVAAGAMQGDLVLHCGESTAGRYCATLVAVDVATTWTELQAIWDLHQQRVTGGIQPSPSACPLPCASGIATTAASLSTAACSAGVAATIRFTRGRPYRKNDQAWVEQRNGLLVRRLVGYDRYSSRAALAVLQRLYGLLRLQHNFFRPVRKLLSKRRVGSKVVKRYDKAQTPYQRVLAAGGLTRTDNGRRSRSSVRPSIRLRSPATSNSRWTSCGSSPILVVARTGGRPWVTQF